MDAPVQFSVFLVVSFAVLLVIGANIVRSLTLALEAKYEFTEDSLTKRSRLKGFIFFGFWSLAAVVNWSFAFDWYLSGSSQVAFERLWDKAHIILILLEALSSD